MKQPASIEMDGRQYAVIDSYSTGSKEPRTVLPPAGHVFIRGDHWPLGHTPSPFRWPPMHQSVTWRGDIALLQRNIQ